MNWLKKNNTVLSGDDSYVHRPNAMTIDGPAFNDAMAVHEIEDASAATKELMIERMYSGLPANKLANAHCSGTQYITGDNTPLKRFMKWKNEDYFIVESNGIYTGMSILNAALMLSLIVLAYFIWKYDCEVSVVPKASNTSISGDNLKMLQDWNKLGSYINTGLASLLAVYTMQRVFKRTTTPCSE